METRNKKKAKKKKKRSLLPQLKRSHSKYASHTWMIPHKTTARAIQPSHHPSRFPQSRVSRFSSIRPRSSPASCQERRLGTSQVCPLKKKLFDYYQNQWLRLWSYLFHFSSLECQNYQSLTSANRKNTYVTISAGCDSGLGPGWFRFQGDAGTKMPTSCVTDNRCDTHAPGWLNGAHPSVADGKVTRQVCFNYFSNCCIWSINIQLRNCGDYFVYYISGTPPEHPCELRYCGADWTLASLLVHSVIQTTVRTTTNDLL